MILTGRVKDLLTKVQQKDNRGAGSMQDVFNVPANKCGLVIGKVRLSGYVSDIILASAILILFARK